MEVLTHVQVSNARESPAHCPRRFASRRALRPRALTRVAGRAPPRAKRSARARHHAQPWAEALLLGGLTWAAFRCVSRQRASSRRPRAANERSHRHAATPTRSPRRCARACVNILNAVRLTIRRAASTSFHRAARTQALGKRKREVRRTRAPRRRKRQLIPFLCPPAPPPPLSFPYRRTIPTRVQHYARARPRQACRAQVFSRSPNPPPPLSAAPTPGRRSRRISGASPEMKQPLHTDKDDDDEVGLERYKHVARTRL